MGVLEQIIDLQKKGVPEKDIIRNLKQQGVSPKDIADGLSQARVKTAVSSQGNESMEKSIMNAEEDYSGQDLPTEGSISDEDLTPMPTGIPPIMQQMARIPLHKDVDEEYAPSPGEEQYESQQYPQQYQYQPQEYQPQDGNTYQQGMISGGDTDTIIEISEQVFAERMKGAVKQIESFNEFKTLTQAKVENMSERLKRIESTIDMLQIAILEKVGVYGRNIESIRKEMDMMQDSFGKVVNKTVERNANKSYESKPQSYYESPSPQQQIQTPQIQRIEKKTTVVHKSQNPKQSKKISKR